MYPAFDVSLLAVVFDGDIDLTQLSGIVWIRKSVIPSDLGVLLFD